MSELLVVHHAAQRNHTHPPSSLSAIRDCLESGALTIEVDVTPLRDGAFALLHDSDLAQVTDGTGAAAGVTGAQVVGLHYRKGETISLEPVGLLSQAVALVEAHADLQELQLDLKPHAPLRETVLLALIATIQPILDRVRVTSMADWALRRLRALAPNLQLGFDPLLYLRPAEAAERDDSLPPFRVGAYGYPDDHPLSTRIWSSPSDYLEARAEALHAQAPPDCAWYIEATLLRGALKDGFDWIRFLHDRGSVVDGWTLDADSPADLKAARQLVAAGVDRITTNDAPALASALAREAVSSDETRRRRITY